MKEFWDARYREKSLAYGEEPNVFFQTWIDQQAVAGRILFPAEGQGRNAVYAATKGWEVYAFDLSEAGAKTAHAAAERQGVTIDFWVGSALDYRLPVASVDALVLVYAHFPEAQREAIHRRMWETLKPGGTLVLEAFQPQQLGRTSGGPTDPTMLYTIEQLQRDFPEMVIQHWEYASIELAEGTYHTGQAEVIRLVAQKPVSND